MGRIYFGQWACRNCVNQNYVISIHWLWVLYFVEFSFFLFRLLSKVMPWNCHWHCTDSTPSGKWDTWGLRANIGTQRMNTEFLLWLLLLLIKIKDIVLIALRLRLLFGIETVLLHPEAKGKTISWSLWMIWQSRKYSGLEGLDVWLCRSNNYISCVIIKR